MKVHVLLVYDWYSDGNTWVDSVWATKEEAEVRLEFLKNESSKLQDDFYKHEESVCDGHIREFDIGVVPR